MLCRQHGGIDRSEARIGNDEGGKPQPHGEIVEDDVLIVVPAQRTDNAAAPLHRQIVRALLRATVVLCHLGKVHRAVLDLRREMRRDRISINIGDGDIRCIEPRSARHMEGIARQECAVCSDLRARERRLIVARRETSITETLHDQPRDIRLSDVRSRSRDK